jgi:hypothetical protein
MLYYQPITNTPPLMNMLSANNIFVSTDNKVITRCNPLIDESDNMLSDNM